MASFLEDLIKNDTEYLVKILSESGKEIKAEIDDLLYNFDQFFKTGDTSFLVEECKKLKQNCEPNEPIQNKKKNRKKAILTDITELNIVEKVKIKNEKLSTILSASEEGYSNNSEAINTTGKNKCFYLSLCNIVHCSFKSQNA